MPSRRLQTLCVAMFILCLWWIDKQDARSLWFLIPSGVLAIASFIYGDLVNRWWYKHYPPDLTDYEKRWLLKMVPYFRNLSDAQQDRFCKRMALEKEEKEFINMSEQPVPEEWKLMALSPAIYLGLHRDLPQAEPYNRIVFYLHAFPSPHQAYLHISEHEPEDGVIIFSLPHLESAYRSPGSFFNIAHYEWGIIWYHIHIASVPSTLMNHSIVDSYCQCLGILPEDLTKYLGQPALNPAGLFIDLVLTKPQWVKTNLPELYQVFMQFESF